MMSGTAPSFYYFDTLPVRPQPEHLESCTSYLTRLAERNGVSSVDGLAALCFPHQDRRITRDLADYPPTSFQTLTRAAACSEATLVGTTFFHLGTKFGRSSKPQPLSRFLSGSVVPYLRYCSLCLGTHQQPYYSLLWRFVTLKGCPVHCCKLLDRCERCGNVLSLLASPLKVGKCALCGLELKACRSEPIPEAELAEALDHARDLEFLLLPLLSSEMNDNRIAQMIGLRLKYERKAREYTASEIAHRIGVTLNEVEGIERGNILGKGAKFYTYVKYARSVEVTLRCLFTEVAQGEWDQCSAQAMPKGTPACPRCSQSGFVVKFGHNHSGSRRYRCQYCHRYFTPHSISARTLP
jgi:DNA-binding XRE family transcriptional regulator